MLNTITRGQKIGVNVDNSVPSIVELQYPTPSEGDFASVDVPVQVYATDNVAIGTIVARVFDATPETSAKHHT